MVWSYYSDIMLGDWETTAGIAGGALGWGMVWYPITVWYEVCGVELI